MRRAWCSILIRGRGLAICLAVVVSVQTAGGAVISEVLTADHPGGAGGTWPAYVELSLGDAALPLDLVVLNAHPFMDLWVQQIITVSGPVGVGMAVAHGPTWPSAEPPEVLRTVVGDPLELSGGGNASRHLVLFDGLTDPAHWEVNRPAPDQSVWPDIADVVTYSIGGWPAAALPGHDVLDLAPNDAIFLLHDIDGQLMSRQVGAVNGQLANANGWSLDPGIPNVPSELPEPGTAACLMVLTAIGVRLRRVRSGGAHL